MGNNKGKQESKLSRCIRAPIRILCSARDFYVKSMTQCAGSSYATAMATSGPVSILPKSFSTSSSSRFGEDEDMRELIRAASQKGLMDKISLEIKQKQQWQRSGTGGFGMKSEGLPRSLTVGIGRIDEDKPCEFADDCIEKPGTFYPRSKSYATHVTKRSSGFFS